MIMAYCFIAGLAVGMLISNLTLSPKPAKGKR